MIQSDRVCILKFQQHTKRDRREERGEDRSIQERTRKANSQAAGDRAEDFNSKRPRQTTGNRNINLAEKFSQPDERVTHDFLDKKLEVLKAEIQQSVMIQLMDLKSFLQRQFGAGEKPHNPWGIAGTQPLYQTFAS
jgi:hypothetical protein